MNDDKNQTGAENTPEAKKPNVGSGPVKEVHDGGVKGETKQPKEHTGKDTEMGGATGGTHNMGNASEGNDNTGTAG